MKLSGVPFYPAHSSNYTKGRNRALKHITIHHTAANNTTLRHLWANPDRNGSSHFFVSKDVIEQYVDTKDTAWTNSNFKSNSESITIEVNGNWQGAYHNKQTLEKLTKLLRELLKHYPHLTLTYHNQFTNTICPGTLRSKGYAKAAYDKAKESMVSNITYKAIPKKKVVLTRDASLWNFDFTKWSDAKAVRNYKKGHVVEVVAEAKNALGGRYYMTAYSYNGGKIRSTNGFNTADVKDYTPPKPPTDPCKAVKAELKEKSEVYVKAMKANEKLMEQLQQKIEEVEIIQTDLDNSKDDVKDLNKEIRDLEKENSKLSKENSRLVLELGEKGELTALEHFRLGLKKLIERIMR